MDKSNVFSHSLDPFEPAAPRKKMAATCQLGVVRPVLNAAPRTHPMAQRSRCSVRETALVSSTHRRRVRRPHENAASLGPIESQPKTVFALLNSKLASQKHINECGQSNIRRALRMENEINLSEEFGTMQAECPFVWRNSGASE